MPTGPIAASGPPTSQIGSSPTERSIRPAVLTKEGGHSISWRHSPTARPTRQAWFRDEARAQDKSGRKLNSSDSTYFYFAWCDRPLPCTLPCPGGSYQRMDANIRFAKVRQRKLSSRWSSDLPRPSLAQLMAAGISSLAPCQIPDPSMLSFSMIKDGSSTGQAISSNATQGRAWTNCFHGDPRPTLRPTRRIALDIFEVRTELPSAAL